MKLKDICRLSLGYQFRSKFVHNPKGDVFVVQANNILKNGVIDNLYSKVALSRGKKSEFLKKDDVLLTFRNRFCAGIIENLQGKFIASSTVYILRVRFLDKLIPRYLMIYLNSSLGQRSLKRQVQQSTIFSLSRKDLGELDISIPRREKQEEVINFHSIYNRYAQLEERKMNLMKQMSKEFIENLIRSREVIMAKNPPIGDGHRKGAVRQRSQFKAPNGNWTKRNTKTGRFMDQKTSGGKFKGVRKEQ